MLGFLEAASPPSLSLSRHRAARARPWPRGTDGGSLSPVGRWDAVVSVCMLVHGRVVPTAGVLHLMKGGTHDEGGNQLQSACHQGEGAIQSNWKASTRCNQLRRDVHTAACRSHLLLALRDEVSSVLELLLQYTLVPVGNRGGVRAVMSSCTHWVHEHRPTYT